MTAEDWELIKTLFETALGLPECDRESFLLSACAGRPTILAAVRELIGNHAEDSDGGENISLRRQALFPGDLVDDRFRIVRLIATGGMGEVYEAFDEKLRLRLALKTLRGELVGEDDAMERFRREVRVARGVVHESLCRVFDLVEQQSVSGGPPLVCLTMELLDGETLARRLERDRPLNVEEALPVIRQIAAALDMLHSNGIVHRDLKPSNVILTRAGSGNVRAVVTDFGLAKSFTGDPSFFESRMDRRIGAPFFMAPELWDDGRPSIASDVYALGLVIDEMVTKSRAFPVGSLPGLYFAKLREGPVRPSLRSNGLPAHWERTILRCVDPRPERRYAHVSDLVNDLAAAHLTPFSWRFSGLPIRPRSLMRRRVLLAGVAGSLTVLAGLNLRPLQTSIAVFPIQNQTDAKDLDYFCTGTTAEVLRRLLAVEGLRVLPVYDTHTQGRASRATSYSMFGLLHADNGALRLSVQVVDNHTGELAWADSFDERTIQNPLDLQSQIAQQILRALVDSAGIPRFLRTGGSAAQLATSFRRLLPFERPILQSVPTRSSAALDQYMRGRHLLSDMSVPSALAAVRFFEEAIHHDPRFALAYSALADAQSVFLEYNYAPDSELLGRAREFAEKAVRTGPNLPESHTSLAAVQQMSWEWSEANRSFREALRLNPRLALAHRWYSGLLLHFGQFARAIEESQVAVDLDPYDYPAYPGYGLVLFCAGKYDQAIAILQRAIAERELLPARHNLASIYAKLASISTGPRSRDYFRLAIEQADKSAAEEARLGKPAGTVGYADRMYALAYALSGNPRATQPYLDRLIQDMRAGRTSPAMVAWVYTALGDYDRALSLLEQAVGRKDRKLLNIKVHPLLEPLRTARRFQALLAAMGLLGNGPAG